MTLSIDFKILNPLIKDHIPTYASEGSAGLDLRACIDRPYSNLNRVKLSSSRQAYQFSLKTQVMLRSYYPDQVLDISME